MSPHTLRVRDALYAHRRIAANLIYALITAAAYDIAFQLVFRFRVPPEYTELFLQTLPAIVLVRVVAFRWTKLTRERWRYASTHSVVRLLMAMLCGTLLCYALDLTLPLEPRVPLAVLAMEFVLTSWLTGGAWLAYRLAFERWHHAGPPGRTPERDGRTRERVLIVGAGAAGRLLAAELRRLPAAFELVGFVDDDPMSRGASVYGLDVIGGTDDLAALVAARDVQQLLIAMPSAPPEQLRRIVERCAAAGAPFKVLPGIRDVLSGDVNLGQLRAVQIEDLLGREPIELALPELAADLCGRTVLITGAAGSIGAELARQVALHAPARLLLLDQAETPLFYLDLELRAQHPALDIVPVVADIVDEPGLERLFVQHAPERVFHAAAYKHVPMMELNPHEAVRNNVLGTWRIASLAGRHGAEKFVLVSTDKAVAPASVMGATKRCAELIVLELQQRFADTAYGAVRFGNVLGSQGSVIPVFKRQLADGLPLTVTHPQATRYFMTIPEAVQLILQASLLDGFRGRIAMLEMGEPVRILDLALNLLRLSGAANPREKIVFTGLRPGEKLHEELAAADEAAEATPIPKVRLLTTPTLTDAAFIGRLEAWHQSADDEVDEDFLQAVAELFPDVRFETGKPGDRGGLRAQAG